MNETFLPNSGGTNSSSNSGSSGVCQLLDYTIKDLKNELAKIEQVASDSFKSKIKSMFNTADNNSNKKSKTLIITTVKNYKKLIIIYKTDSKILEVLQNKIKLK